MNQYIPEILFTSRGVSSVLGLLGFCAALGYMAHFHHLKHRIEALRLLQRDQRPAALEAFARKFGIPTSKLTGVQQFQLLMSDSQSRKGRDKLVLLVLAPLLATCILVAILSGSASPPLDLAMRPGDPISLDPRSDTFAAWLEGINQPCNERMRLEDLYMESTNPTVTPEERRRRLDQVRSQTPELERKLESYPEAHFRESFRYCDFILKYFNLSHLYMLDALANADLNALDGTGGLQRASRAAKAALEYGAIAREWITALRANYELTKNSRLESTVTWVGRWQIEEDLLRNDAACHAVLNQVDQSYPREAVTVALAILRRRCGEIGSMYVHESRYRSIPMLNRVMDSNAPVTRS